ncbi:DUF6398 domain-containing protein [Frigoriglobus tundricola]|uniref:DUF6398 domain-containing protein n=1 Tax=Frigoriglobus tundricola TaxID=2774151 RepID=A0A6M5YVD9_9BACT|nr:DUF6398 domain-containing protein [Frigoriglobus tundricola]QJW97336.1 hypothetical protein FTUN_4906 [Frigoriglobus tundricola]
MLLEPDDLELFFRLHKALMFFVNQRLRVLPDALATPEDFAALPPTTRLAVRDAFVANLDLIDAFATQNPGPFSGHELDIVRSWRHLVAGEFYVFRELKRHTVFLSSKEPVVAYGVLALSQPFEDLIGPYLPVLTKTVLLPFRDQIVYDGLLQSYNVSFGPGIRRSLNESFQEAKARQGIVTALPMAPTSQAPAASQKVRPRAKARTKEADADAVRVILDMVDRFCREHLNEEYAQLCRRLADKLARKRPSPLLSGRPNTWACGIVRTIGWVNYLDDPSQEPHMKLTAIDKAFGVGESTGQGKSMLIRKTLKIRSMDPAWTLPSRMDRNPMAWLIEVNGLPFDARYLSREIQEEALRKGLIPYIPERPGTAEHDAEGEAE